MSNLFEFSYGHFSQHLDSRERIKFIKILNEYDQQLIDILIKELNGNNKISNVTTRWPSEFSICVQLEFPFVSPISNRNLVLHSETDIHYGKSQFYISQINHVIYSPIDPQK